MISLTFVKYLFVEIANKRQILTMNQKWDGTGNYRKTEQSQMKLKRFDFFVEKTVEQKKCNLQKYTQL